MHINNILEKLTHYMERDGFNIESNRPSTNK